MKLNKKLLLLTVLIILLPALLGVLKWNDLPEAMATHFDIHDQPDGYSSKAFAVFGLPIFLAASQVFTVIIVSADPKKQNLSPRIGAMIYWIIPLIGTLTNGLVYAQNLGFHFSVGKVIFSGVAVLFIVIGNYLPKCRQNYTVGIRLPWTLNNEENWNLTHRMAGPLWIFCGFAILFAGIFEGLMELVLFPALGVMIIVPSVYSYWLHRNKGL
ncbi:MAG: SdpI family protein [Firmicutes bacterium]|nr:SdpI family protein [Bacillota bacterium]